MKKEKDFACLVTVVRSRDVLFEFHLKFWNTASILREREKKERRKKVCVREKRERL